jgi:homoserine dehydrogenase
VGGVGKCFLPQLQGLAARLSQNPAHPMYLNLILLSRSKTMAYKDGFQPLKLSEWESEMERNAKHPIPLPELAEFLAVAPEKVILVDNTSSQDVADHYPNFLRRGISIVTANKKGFSGSYGLWQDIFSAAANGTGQGGWIFHESACGAGLPTISTLKDLVETGDEIRQIEGVLSGTMSFLFNNFMPVGGGGGSFSQEVKKAKELGYTEPDPRDDLNGLDVARKLTILGRLAGMEIESPTSFPVQSLIPKELESVDSGDEFIENLGQYDDQMDKLKQEALSEGKVLRYVGSIDLQAKRVEVGLKKYNLFPVRRRRYSADM